MFVLIQINDIVVGDCITRIPRAGDSSHSLKKRRFRYAACIESAGKTGQITHVERRVGRGPENCGTAGINPAAGGGEKQRTACWVITVIRSIYLLCDRAGGDVESADFIGRQSVL